MEQFLAPDEGDGRILGNFGGNFMVRRCQGCAQSQHLSGTGCTKNDPLTRLGTHGKAHAPLANEKDAAGRMAFAEENCSLGKGLCRLDAVKGGKRLWREIAKYTIRSPTTIQAAVRHRILSL
jgi:hypothetical protein